MTEQALRRWEIVSTEGTRYIYADRIGYVANDIVLMTQDGGIWRWVALLPRDTITSIIEVAAMLVIPRAIQAKDRANQQRMENK